MTASEDESASLRAALDAARRQIVEMERQNRRLREELARFRQSAAGRMAMRLQEQARRAVPAGSRRQRGLHTIAQGTATLFEQGPGAVVEQLRRDRRQRRASGAGDAPAARLRQYRHWLELRTPSAGDLEAMRAASARWPVRPLISLILPVHDPDPAWLSAAVASVAEQAYEHWELCIADDASTDPRIGRLLHEIAAGDPRVKLALRESRGGISAASNSALEMATGEYVGMLDHDDVLRSHALHAMVAVVAEHPALDVIYSDEDMLFPDGTHRDPMFKPDHSPELLLSCNYITHFVLLRRDLVHEVGGFRSEFDGSQDHDLLLRATERTSGIAHVADVLYAWRRVPGSAATSADEKPLAREAGRRAVLEALHRRGHDGSVDFGASPGIYDVRYAIRGTPTVDIVIPTRDRVDLLTACIASVERLSTWPHRRIIVVDNGSREPATIAHLAGLSHEVVRVEAPFNYAQLVNRGAAAGRGEHVLLLNDDTTVITPGWLEAMLGLSQWDDVGAVGARLLYPDGGVQHEGIVCGRLHLAANVHIGIPAVRECSAVTGACLMTRRAVFDEAGGFDERFARAFNDVDYCLRARRAGRRVLFTPLAQLHHREGATRGRADTPESDRRAFIERWGDIEDLEDPYLNVNVLWPNPLRLRLD